MSTTKKPAAKAPAKKKQHAKPAAQAAILARTPMDIPASKLHPAAWNPRPKITPESVADLTASIAKDGLIQRLVVIKNGDGYDVVAGNRRLVACREAGLDPIPCELMDVTPKMAYRLTLIENLQRQDVDPLLESDLVAELIAGGMSQAEIAAETGRGERWVARRKNLRNLSKSWRARATAGNISTDCLEHVAAYPVEIQDACKDFCIWKDKSQSGTRWNDIASAFQQHSRDLKEAPFPTAACRTCANNTGATPDLFDWDGDKPTVLGRCLCAKCYAKKRREGIAATIEKAKADGVTVINSRPHYCCDTAKRKTQKCTVLHVFEDFDGSSSILWASPHKDDAAPYGASNDSDDLEQHEKEIKEKKKNRNKAIRDLAKICTVDRLAKLLHKFSHTPGICLVDPFVPFVFQVMFAGLDSYRCAGSDTLKEDVATAAMFGNLVVPSQFIRTIASTIVASLDPSRLDGVRAERNAKLILAMSPEIRMELGEEKAEHILPAASVFDFTHPKVKWIGASDDDGDLDNAEIDE